VTLAEGVGHLLAGNEEQARLANERDRWEGVQFRAARIMGTEDRTDSQTYIDAQWIHKVASARLYSLAKADGKPS
jgi:hypothetical protein